MRDGVSPPIPIQIPINSAWEAVDDGPNTCVPATHVGHPEGVPDSWLQPGQPQLLATI